MMATLTVYDPPMCCASGVCGADVDQRLVNLAADLDWLKTQGVAVRRIALSQEPAEFVANETIRDLMQASDGDDLPAFVVDGALVATARYPSRAELAGWVGASRDAAQPAPVPMASPRREGDCCGGSAAVATGAKTGGCC